VIDAAKGERWSTQDLDPNALGAAAETNKAYRKRSDSDDSSTNSAALRPPVLQAATIYLKPVSRQKRRKLFCAF